MIQLIWCLMVTGSLGYAMLAGTGSAMLEAALAGCEKAILLTLQLGAGYVLFSGLMEMGKAAGMQQGVKKLLRPVLRWLTPAISKEETREAVVLSIAMNLLGLGNAATPAGIKAMRLMEDERLLRPQTGHDMEMFLILTATGLQLLPTTVLALRAAAGSVRVNAVLVPVLICTGISSTVGIGLGLLMRWREERKRG